MRRTILKLAGMAAIAAVLGGCAASGAKYQEMASSMPNLKADQGRIFERFYKVDRSRAQEPDESTGGGSAGLGLAIVRHIAGAHGGSVGVHSVEGEGSTFWIELPIG